MNAPGSFPDNRSLLDELFRSGSIDVRRSRLFDQNPAIAGAGPAFERVEGMLLGLAIGDALGATSESQPPDRRRARHGEIRDYLPGSPALWEGCQSGAMYVSTGDDQEEERRQRQGVGLPTDDTQLAFWTLEQTLADGRFVPENVARRFCRQPIYGIGAGVYQFVTNMRAGKPWHQAGSRTAGNGALMRIAPVLVPYVRAATPALWADTALAATITHNDSASIAACLSFVEMLWQLLQMERAPEPEWWLNRYAETARDLEQERVYPSHAPAYAGYQGPLWRFVREAAGMAYEQGLSTLDACSSWRSGAYLMESMPSVIYILMRFGHDPEAAIVRAVNDTFDNDSAGAIVGAAVGALHGRAGLPERWTRGLLGRTAEADDGQVFRLLDQARRRWWGQPGEASR
jgi:ADP-ribosylglycohydrolase